MKCTEAESLIAEKVLGFISVERKKELDDHLAVCFHCRQEMERYCIAEEALRAGAPEQMQPDLADRVVSLAGSAKGNGLRLLKLGAPALAAAAVLLAVVISPVFFSNNGNDMTKLEVLEAYAQDIEVLGMGEGVTASNAEIDYERYGVSDEVSGYLIQ